MIHLLSMTVPMVVSFDQDFETEELLNFAIGAFSIVLLVLSLSAYRRTHMNRLLLVSAAFGLFALEVVVDQLDFFVFPLSENAEGVITALLSFVILLLFFFAVVRGDQGKAQRT
jgi:integral membrane sensor domain MASE1